MPVFVLLILLAIGSRLIPHPPNWTAVGALAVFGAYSLDKQWMKYLVPLAAMIISDAIIGFHSGIYVIYACMILSVLLGDRYFTKKPLRFVSVAGVTLNASLLFFVITNFMVWLQSGLYEKSLAGLILCYQMALPFFQNQILGDMFYSSILYFGFVYINKRKTAII
jgi:hypothetical protein